MVFLSDHAGGGNRELPTVMNCSFHPRASGSDGFPSATIA